MDCLEKENWEAIKFVPTELKMGKTFNPMTHTSVSSEEDILSSIRSLYQKEENIVQPIPLKMVNSDSATQTATQVDNKINRNDTIVYGNLDEATGFTPSSNNENNVVNLRRSFNEMLQTKSLTDDEIIRNLKKLYNENDNEIEPCCSRLCGNNGHIQVEFYNTTPSARQSVICIGDPYLEYNDGPMSSVYLENKMAHILLENNNATLMPEQATIQENIMPSINKATEVIYQHEHCEDVHSSCSHTDVDELQDEDNNSSSNSDNTANTAENIKYLDRKIEINTDYESLAKKHKQDLYNLSVLKEQKKMELINAKIERQALKKVQDNQRFKKEMDILNAKLAQLQEDAEQINLQFSYV